MDKVSIITELSKVANIYGLDTEANMPDFIIGSFMYECIMSLMAANKTNGQYFKLSAQEEEKIHDR